MLFLKVICLYGYKDFMNFVLPFVKKFDILCELLSIDGS